MPLFYGTMALAVGSNVLYHLFQKATPETINLLVALAATYATALAIRCWCAVLSNRRQHRHLAEQAELPASASASSSSG